MGGRSAYTTAAQPCRGSTRLGVRCRRTTKNPSGWCGECDGSGRDEPPLGRALTAAEVGAPPEPLTLDERRAAVAAGPPVPGWRARWLLFRSKLTRSDTDVTAVAAGDHGPLSPAARRLLERHPSWQVRGALIEHPDTAPGELSRALGDPDWRVVLLAAEHPNLSGVDATAMLSHSNRRIRAAAAANPGCEPFALRWAAQTGDKDADLMINIAGNPATDAATLDWIVARADGRYSTTAVITALSNPNCPPAALARVAADPHEPDAFRDAAAANPSCPSVPRTIRGLEAD